MSDPYTYPGSGTTPPVGSYGPAPGLVYAGFGSRLVAWIIDGIIVGIITSAIAAALGVDLSKDYGIPVLSGPWIASVVLDAIISGIYFVGSWRAWNATPGQRIMSLQVRNAADGSTITQETAIKRWAYLTLPIVGSLGAIGILVLIYYIFLAVSTNNDPYKRGWHDKQCGTVVVKQV